MERFTVDYDGIRDFIGDIEMDSIHIQRDELKKMGEKIGNWETTIAKMTDAADLLINHPEGFGNEYKAINNWSMVHAKHCQSAVQLFQRLDVVLAQLAFAADNLDGACCEAQDKELREYQNQKTGD
jgi:hypothetical protein